MHVSLKLRLIRYRLRDLAALSRLHIHCICRESFSIIRYIDVVRLEKPFGVLGSFASRKAVE